MTKKRTNPPLRIRGFLASDWEKKATNNVFFDIDGTAATRPALTKTNPTAIADALAGAAVMISIYNGKKYWVSGSSIYEEGTNKHTYSSTPVHSLAAELFNKLYIAADWEGASEVISVIDSSGVWAETTGTYDGVNKVKAGIVTEHRGILFCGRMKEGSTQYLNRIRWSNYGDAQDFDPSGDSSYDSFEDIGDDTDPIINLVSYGNDLYIFKRRSVWIASGVASDVVAPEYVRQLTTEYGLVGPRAITLYNNGIIFLSDVGLVYTDGRTFKVIDENLWKWIRPSAALVSDWRDQYVVWHSRLKTLFVYDSNTGKMYAKTNGEWNNWDCNGKPLTRCFGLLNDAWFVNADYGFLKLGMVPATSPTDTVGASSFNINPILDLGWEDFGSPSRTKLFRSVFVNRPVTTPADHGVFTVTVYRDYTATNTQTAYLINNQGWADVGGSAKKWKTVISLTRPGTDVMDIEDVTVGVIPTGGV